MNPNEARAHLGARYPKLAGADDARLVHAISTSDLREEWRDIAVRWKLGEDATPGAGLEQYPPASAEDLEAALVLLADARTWLDYLEARLLDSARDRRMSWQRIATALNLGSARRAQQRRRQLPSPAAPSLLDPDRRTTR